MNLTIEKEYNRLKLATENAYQAVIKAQSKSAKVWFKKQELYDISVENSCNFFDKHNLTNNVSK